jgi:aldehyde dehydrogenase (NAD+)
MSSAEQIVKRQKEYYQTGATKEVSFRIEQLKKLKKLLKNHEKEIFDALEKDFSKPPFETYGTELGILYTELDHLIKHVASWAKPKTVSGSLINFPSKNTVYSEPYGVALVIGAWNYPIQLTLNPVIGAMAAGNCVIAKPSEMASRSSAIMARFINEAFDPGYLHVVEGAAETSQQLLDAPPDYIFFTGSTRVGKIIMKAAAEHLIPVTLELGGKSPAIVDETADLHTAAKRIAWGKFVNAGQTCVAPDYLYVHSSVQSQLMDELRQSIKEFYGTNPAQSPDYPRIINDDHFNRLTDFLNNGTITAGGEHASDERYIAPTILSDVSWNDAVMQEEIFGPVLPVLSYEEIEEAINQINTRPKPLALYLFSETKSRQQRIINEIPFGGGCINDSIAHLGNHNLPFGGIGNSGMGSYHGKASFDVFSHRKSIMKKTTWFDVPLRYPPYKDNLKWLKKLIN